MQKMGLKQRFTHLAPHFRPCAHTAASPRRCTHAKGGYFRMQGAGTSIAGGWYFHSSLEMSRKALLFHTFAHVLIVMDISIAMNACLCKYSEMVRDNVR